MINLYKFKNRSNRLQKQKNKTGFSAILAENMLLFSKATLLNLLSRLGVRWTLIINLNYFANDA